MSFKPTAGRISRTAPAWSDDGDHLTVPSGRLLHTYALRTSPPSRVGTLVGHAARVTCVVTLPHLRLLSASVDGTLREWDQLSGHCLCTRDLARPIREIVALPAAALVLFDNSLTYHPLPRAEPQSSHARPQPVVLVSNLKRASAHRNHLASDPDGQLVAVASDRFLFLTAAPRGAARRNKPGVADDTDVYPHLRIVFPFTLTAVAVSPDGRSVAVADTAGKIYLQQQALKSLGARGARGSPILTLAQFRPTVLHWHSSEVPALTFSRDGAALLSAGHEAVLVSWALSSHRVGTPSFLPRLRAPVHRVAVPKDGSRVALVQEDNTARIVDVAAGEVVSELRGIAPPVSSTNGPLDPPRLFQTDGSASVIHGGGPNLIVAAGPCVQTFDALAGEHVTERSVVTRNLPFEKNPAKDPYSKLGAHRTENSGRPQHPHVTTVARSPDGQWLATVDLQKVETSDKTLYGGEGSITTLRIWQASKEGNHGYEPVSETQHPHGVDVDVSALIFHPRLPVLLTTSAMGSFRLWRAAKGRDGEVIFRCEMKREYRGLPCMHGAFSDDGSLLAIACGSVLTLWQLEDISQRPGIAPPGDANCSLYLHFLQALVHPPAEESIMRVAYVTRKVPLFIALTLSGIYVWNGFTQSLWWSSRLLTSGVCLAVDEATSRFAIPVQIPLVTDDTEGPATMEEENLQIENLSALKNEDVHIGTVIDPDSKPTKRRTQLRMAARSKSEKTDETANAADQNQEAYEKSAPKRIRPDPMTDWVIAEFDAGSPVPLRVVRLSSGAKVRALAFVYRDEKTQGSGGENDAGQLICVDSHGEVSVLLGDDETDEFATRHTHLLASVEPPESAQDGLTGLLGADWRKSAAKNEADAPDQADLDAVRMPGNLKKAFDTHFDGPVHIQAAVSTKSLAFLESILEGMDDYVEGKKIKDKKGEPERSEDTKTKTDAEHSTAVRLSDTEIQLACRNLLRSLPETTAEGAKV